VACTASLEWPTDQPDGQLLFSLRPEAISLVERTAPSPDAVRFHATVRQQIYSGSSEDLEVDCAGQLLRVRTAARGVLSGEHEFCFLPLHAVPVKES
jgi:hypothetical protein